MDLKSPKAVRQRNFIRAIYYDVEHISKDSGIPTKLVLAMAALETEWGEKFLFEDSGNIFNVKAFSNYNGKKTAKKDVLEYEADGTPTTENSSFRIYDSYIESIEGLIELLKTDKYKVVRNMKSIENKADALGPGFIGPELIGPRLKGAGYATNPKYGELLRKILRQYRLKDALKGLPAGDELEERFLEKFCSELEYKITLPGYRGQAIARSELAKTIRAYTLNVCHQGDKVGEITTNNLELRLNIPLNITYRPGAKKSDKSYYPDLLKINYRPPGGLKKIAWWNIDMKKFIEVPSGYKFRQ